MNDNLSDTDSIDIPSTNANLAFESKVWHLRCGKQIKECETNMNEKFLTKKEALESNNSLLRRLNGGIIGLISIVAIASWRISAGVTDIKHVMVNQGQQIIELQKKSEISKCDTTRLASKNDDK